jgi:transposase
MGHPQTAVDDVAWELGSSRATLYRLITRYRMTRSVEGLREPGRGRRAGTRSLCPAKETLIREIIEREYLKPTRHDHRPKPIQPGSPGSTAMTCRFGAGAQDANVCIAFDAAIDIRMQASASLHRD